jgi:LPXTG-site transpeptidase (sortase) family protein
MVSSSSRPGVFLLAIATMMFSLVLLSATSSRAQTEPEDQNNSAKAAVGDEECVEFENEGSNTGTTNGDTGTNTSEDTSFGVNQDNATGDSATDDNASGDNIASDNSTDDPNATYQNTDTDGDTGTDTGTMNQDAETANQDAGTGTNGEDFTTSQDEGTGSEDGTTLQDDATGSDGTTSSQDGETGNEECVVADTVPDESLLPTGAPASSSPTDEKTAEKESDRDGAQESRKGTTQGKNTNGEARKKSNDTGKQQKVTNSGTQKKTGDGSRQKKTRGGEANSKSNRSETRNASGSVGTTQGKSNGSEALKKSGGGETVRVRGTELEVDDRAGKEPLQEELKARAQFAAASDLAPRLAATEWTRPAREEVASTGKPRNFAPDPNAQMTFSARALGLYDMPVASSERLEDLDTGLVHVPETSRPWDEGSQKNVFIAGHYLGTPQTLSRLAFYNLHKLKSGDELVLEDGRGQAYKYRVSEKFAVEAGDSWAMGEVRDRDMVTLQTCIPPDFGKRLMVRADRVRD